MTGSRAPRGVAWIAVSGAVCLVLGIGAAARSAQSASEQVTMRSLSTTDVVALPAGGEQSPLAARARVVVLGDSVGTGSGCACTAFGPRLARLLTRSSHRPTRVQTLAADGQDSAGLLVQLDNDAATISALREATSVIVTVGANDFDSAPAADGCGGTGTACYAAGLQVLSERLRQVVARIRALTAPSATIILMGYWNVFLDGDVGARQGSTYKRTSDALTELVNAVLRETARTSSATYVDLYGPFMAAGDDTGLLAPDGDHPNRAGNQRIAETLARAYLGG